MLMKWQVENAISWQNGKEIKQKVDKMANWWNGIVGKEQIDKMANKKIHLTFKIEIW